MDTQESIKRFKNWRTTIIGIPVLLFVGFMIYADARAIILGLEMPFAVATEIIPSILLGYSFVFAKDTLLEGITMGLFKINKKD